MIKIIAGHYDLSRNVEVNPLFVLDALESLGVTSSDLERVYATDNSGILRCSIEPRRFMLDIPCPLGLFRVEFIRSLLARSFRLQLEKSEFAGRIIGCFFWHGDISKPRDTEKGRMVKVPCAALLVTMTAKEQERLNDKDSPVERGI